MSLSSEQHTINICIYCEMIAIGLTDIHHRHTCHVFLVMRTFKIYSLKKKKKIYSLSKLQIYNAVLLTTVTMLHITSHNITLITGICNF